MYSKRTNLNLSVSSHLSPSFPLRRQSAPSNDVSSVWVARPFDPSDHCTITHYFLLIRGTFSKKRGKFQLTPPTNNSVLIISKTNSIDSYLLKKLMYLLIFSLLLNTGPRKGFNGKELEKVTTVTFFNRLNSFFVVL